MKNFFKTRFFIAVLIIALAMIAVPSILTAMGLSDVVQSGIAAILMPGQKLFSFAADGLSGYAAYFTEYDRLAAENERLKSDLAKMNDKVYTAEELERMNDWLYDYLELKREHMDFSLTEAAVTGRGSSNYISVLTIDRGTSSGCLENMPVVTSDGIVGYIAEAGAHWAKVVTIAEASSATGAVHKPHGGGGTCLGKLFSCCRRTSEDDISFARQRCCGRRPHSDKRLRKRISARACDRICRFGRDRRIQSE